jgi:hypothetical protein
MKENAVLKLPSHALTEFMKIYHSCRCNGISVARPVNGNTRTLEEYGLVYSSGPAGAGKGNCIRNYGLTPTGREIGYIVADLKMKGQTRPNRAGGNRKS